MVQTFTTVSLTGLRIAEALPLVQATWPGVDLSAWRGFVRSFTRKSAAPMRSGVIALLDGSGGLCGILAYRCELDLADGRVFSVRLFSAVDLHNSSAPARALLNVAKAQARRHGCRSIHIRLTPEQPLLEHRIRSLGVAPVASIHRGSLELSSKLN